MNDYQRNIMKALSELNAAFIMDPRHAYDMLTSAHIHVEHARDLAKAEKAKESGNTDHPNK